MDAHEQIRDAIKQELARLDDDRLTWVAYRRRVQELPDRIIGRISALPISIRTLGQLNAPIFVRAWPGQHGRGQVTLRTEMTINGVPIGSDMQVDTLYLHDPAFRAHLTRPIMETLLHAMAEPKFDDLRKAISDAIRDYERRKRGERAEPLLGFSIKPPTGSKP